jgi:hypothetical protein
MYGSGKNQGPEFLSFDYGYGFLLGADGLMLGARTNQEPRSWIVADAGATLLGGWANVNPRPGDHKSLICWS